MDAWVGEGEGVNGFLVREEGGWVRGRNWKVIGERIGWVGEGVDSEGTVDGG